MSLCLLSFSFSAMGLLWDWHALPGHHWSPCKHNVLTTGVCTGTLAWPRGQNTSTAVDWDQTISSHLKSSEPSCFKCYKNYKNEINEWENNCQLLPSSFLKTKEPLTSSLHPQKSHIKYRVSTYVMSQCVTITANHRPVSGGSWPMRGQGCVIPAPGHH